jgi:hypothetical protein
MKKIISELARFDDSTAKAYPFRFGRTLATALTGFIAGAAGTAFYFWFVFKSVLPAYCP